MSKVRYVVCLCVYVQARPLARRAFKALNCVCVCVSVCDILSVSVSESVSVYVSVSVHACHLASRGLGAFQQHSYPLSVVGSWSLYSPSVESP